MGLRWANKVLHAVQVKKLRNVHSAFDAFERISKTPGKADITVVELRVSPLFPQPMIISVH